ncbi:ATPase [Kitasatospora sp. NPDC052868]|uniref:RapZ C-terminal domain-containing protein n=1 Tax=Kitasatospora sp. NPDC052868 TaxID=3364060 RepID=UPI0037C98292
MKVQIVSFGFLNGPVPEAHVVLDLRHHFKDPHVSPELRNMTARDQAVRDTVLGTPGILQVVAAAVTMAQSYAMGPQAETIVLRVAVGCAGGRHRAATVAEVLAQQLLLAQFDVQLTHRDLDKPVVKDGRGAGRADSYADAIEPVLTKLLDQAEDLDDVDAQVLAENAAGALVKAGY